MVQKGDLKPAKCTVLHFDNVTRQQCGQISPSCPESSVGKVRYRLAWGSHVGTPFSASPKSEFSLLHSITKPYFFLPLYCPVDIEQTEKFTS